MKQVTSIFPVLAVALSLSLGVNAQQEDAPDKPGDQFNLQGALELFKNSSSPEDFEKRLNATDNEVNNLDLNNDGQVDYVRVIDRRDGDAHALTLQVPVNDNESQDVAVIEIEKTGDEEAILQIVGDEDIYGEQVIVEPAQEQSPDAAFLDESDRGGPNADAYSPNRIIVNVWIWPGVRFLFRPAYTVWISPFHWNYWPGWYRPWRPWPVQRFYGYHRPYYSRYSYVNVHRVVRADRFYRPYRSSSVIVRSYHRPGYSRAGSVYQRNGRRDARRSGNRNNDRRYNSRRNDRRDENRRNDGRYENRRNENRSDRRGNEGRHERRNDRRQDHREGRRPGR